MHHDQDPAATWMMMMLHASRRHCHYAKSTWSYASPAAKSLQASLYLANRPHTCNLGQPVCSQQCQRVLYLETVGFLSLSDAHTAQLGPEVLALAEKLAFPGEVHACQQDFLVVKTNPDPAVYGD